MEARQILPTSAIRLFGSALLLWAGMACSGETGMDGDEPGAPGQPVTLRLQVGTADGKRQSPVTKANPDDSKSKDHEQIHSLKVFVVDASGKVEKVVPFTFTSDEGTLMENGELTGCVSDDFTLTTGAKTLYAFANCEGLTELNGVLDAAEGNTLTLPATVTWQKEAGWKPGEGENGFIPMTAKEEVTLTQNDQDVSIELIRLLSRIELFFENSTEQEIKVYSWEISGFNPAIPLFKADNAWARLAQSWALSWSNDSQPISLVKDANEKSQGCYYVGESKKEGGFQVKLAYSKGTDTKLTRTKPTTRIDIPRNHVWELEVVFSDYLLGVEGTYGNPPIGGYPLNETTANSVGNMLECTLVGGGPFTLEATLTAQDSQGGSNITVPANVTWTINNWESESGNTLVKDLKVEGNVITGTMAGAPVMVGQELRSDYSFDLIASDANGEIASFAFKLKFKDKFDNQ